MAEAVIVQKEPYAVDLEADKTYYWCSCGLSAKQPFCDGAHKEKGEFTPVEFTVEETKTHYLCGCRRNEIGRASCRERV